MWSNVFYKLDYDGKCLLEVSESSSVNLKANNEYIIKNNPSLMKLKLSSNLILRSSAAEIHSLNYLTTSISGVI